MIANRAGGGLYFDRSKPFYPFVIHYLLTLWAFKEVAAHGMNLAAGDQLAAFLDDAQQLTEADAEALPELVATIAQNPLVEMMPPLSLGKKADGGEVAVLAGDLAREVGQYAQYLGHFTLPAAASLLIATYELTKRHTDKGEIWEFFRHSRHAAAHGGKVTFTRLEPRRPARWRHIVLDRSLQGVPLFDEPPRVGLLRPGDPILLLSDIEAATPGL